MNCESCKRSFNAKRRIVRKRLSPDIVYSKQSVFGGNAGIWKSEQNALNEVPCSVYSCGGHERTGTPEQQPVDQSGREQNDN
ncbi:MAG: hypothetical protein Q4F31_08855, partial [Eubacteriales bacterium]|nr:hypothetical protein [Eubacteriales bacterium]